MKRLLLAVFLLLAARLPARAQLTLYLLSNNAEKPAGALLDMGMPLVGDVRDITVRAHNEGIAKTTLEKLFTAGTGFELIRNPTIPWVVAAGDFVEFGVRFAPKKYGPYSGRLTVNAAVILLSGRTSAALSITDGSVVLGAITPVDFGNVESGTTKIRTFTLRNDSPVTLPVPGAKVLGDAFRGPDGLMGVTELHADSTVAFTVTFAPLDRGPQEGWLQVGDRVYKLLGTGTRPPFPKPVLLLESGNLGSAARSRVLVRFGGAATFDADGTLTMDFQPDPAGAVDEAVQFVAGGRSVKVTTKQGQMDATVDAEFQTGTTAGTILFTIGLGGWTDTLRVPVAAQSVSMLTAKALRSAGQVEIDVTGFDNTRSAGRLTFTFYLTDGSPHPRGPVSVDAAPDFARYFGTSPLGGAFSLRVVFPITGDAAMLSGVEMDVVNSAGSSKTQRLTF